MKRKKSSSALSIATCASMLMACSCSTAQHLPPTAQVSPALLAPPPALPAVQRNSAGEMTGADAQTSLIALYDIAGQIRAAYIELQAQVRLAMGVHDAQGR